MGQKQFDKFRFVPSILNYLTTDPRSTKIHFCQNNIISNVEENLDMCRQRPKYDKTLLPCANDLNFKPALIQIIPSVMFFVTSQHATPDQMVFRESERVVRVCYSSHCSLEELTDFLVHIKPRRIVPNVCPSGNLTLEDVRRSLVHLEVKDRKRVPESRPEFPLTKFKRRRQLWWKTDDKAGVEHGGYCFKSGQIVILFQIFVWCELFD